MRLFFSSFVKLLDKYIIIIINIIINQTISLRVYVLFKNYFQMFHLFFYFPKRNMKERG